MSEWDAFPVAQKSEWDAFPEAKPKAEPIGENRMSAIAALRGIPVVGGFVDKGAAMLNAAAQPLTETGLSHAETYAERVAENQKRIKESVDQYEAEHPIGTTVGKAALGTAALAPLGATATGAKALGLVGGSLARQAGAAAASGAAIGGADAAARGEDILPGAEKGFALGLVGPVAGRAVGKVAQGARDMFGGGKPALPSSDEIKDAATAAYDTIRNMNVKLKPDAIQRVAGDIKTAINAEGFKPYLAGRAHGALDEFADQNSTLNSFSDLHGLRRVLGKAADSLDPTEKAAALAAKEKLDQYLENIPASDVISGNANLASQMLKKANQNYSVAKTSELLQNKIDAADLQASSANSGANFENAARQRVRSILASPKLSRGFSDEEKAAMERFVRGDRTANVMRTVGNLLGGGGGLGAFVSGGGAMLATGSPLGLAAPVIGGAIKSVGNRMSMAQLQRLDEMIRSRAPESAMASALRNAIDARRAKQLALTGNASGAIAPGLVPAFAGRSGQPAE